MNIVLVGMMGSGKSTVGKLLAEQMGIPLIDTDKEIEKISGKTVSEIFEVDGEAKFRRMEREMVEIATATGEVVIATGGGALLDLGNLEILRGNGILIHLKCSAQELQRRLAKNPGRPLLDGKNTPGEIERLLAERVQKYGESDLEVDADKAPEVVAAEIISKLQIRGKVVAVMAEKTMQEMCETIRKAANMKPDLVELRLDSLNNIGEGEISSLIGECIKAGIPAIVTCRIDNRIRKMQIMKIALDCGAVLVDADGELEGLPVERAIASHHDFKGTPELRVLKKIAMVLEDASVVKIACKTETPADERSLLELLEWGIGSGRKISVNSMGNGGKRWRIVSAILGSELIYCHLGKPNAEGQIALEEIMRLKRIWK